MLKVEEKTKIKSFKEIEEILEEMRKAGLKTVQCHGVFDLLHPGHFRHFKMAKKQGDKLIVRSVRSTRQGWDEQFAEMARRGDDTLIDSEAVNINSWDKDEWEWK